MTTRLNRWLLALIAIVGVPFYWLLIDDRPGPVEPHPVSIRQLRDLAQSAPGLAPTRISYERIAWRRIPRMILAAGQGVKLARFNVNAYRLELPDGRIIVIDSGLSADAARRNGFNAYRADAQARVTAELKKATVVLTLSEDELHSGGIRLAGLTRPAANSDDDADCPGPRKLVPGIVEIPVCGKVLATRMVYVHLADGREYLLTGDVAPTMENVLEQAGPSRLMNGIIPQDRSVLHRWLLTVGRLSKQAPDLIIVPGHAPLSSDDFHRGFPGARRV